MNKIKICKITGLPFAIFLVFMCMKLGGTIGWSWWVVTLPLWFSWAMLLTIVLAICLILLAAFVIAFACVGVWAIFVWFISLFRK